MPWHPCGRAAYQGQAINLSEITLNRSERLNAFDDAMPGESRRALQAAIGDVRLQVIVLAGAGKAFCAGDDLKHHAEGECRCAYTQPMP